MPGGYAPPQRLLASPPEFQSVAERDAWYRAHPIAHDDSPDAPAFQPADPTDPYYQRSDIAPLFQATNRNVLGAGHYGIRNFLRTNPLGTIAAFGGLAAGGAALAGGFGGGAAAGAAGGSASNTGLGIFANGGAGGLAGVGGGNAGALAASGGISGGAGIGGATGALVGGGSMGLWDKFLDAVPVIGSVLGSASQSRAADHAADAQVAAAREGIAEQRRQFDTVLDLTKPQRELGYGAVNVLGRINNGDMGAFTASPDYQFRRDEGTRDLGNSFAARGGALSGNALRGITDFNSNLASGEFNNFIQRRLQEAGLGGAATSQAASSATSMGNNVTNLLGQQGDARASGIVGQSNALTNGINDLATWYGDWRKRKVA